VRPAVAAFAGGRFQTRSAPVLGAVLLPILESIGDLRQGSPGHSLPMTIGVEEAQHALGLLERLDQSVEQEPIKTPIPELDAILVMLDEGVHGTLLCGEIPGAYRRERLPLYGHFETCPDLSGSAGMAEGPPIRAGGLRSHRRLSQTRN